MKKISLKNKVLMVLSVLFILSTMALPYSKELLMTKVSAKQRIKEISLLIKVLKNQQELSFTPEKKDPSYYFTKAEEICGFIVKNYNIQFIIYDGLPKGFDGLENTFLAFTSDGKYNPYKINLIKQASYTLYNAGVAILKCNEYILKAIDEIPDGLTVFIGTKKAGAFFGDNNLAQYNFFFKDKGVFWLFLRHNTARFDVTHELGHFIQHLFLPLEAANKKGVWIAPKIQNNSPFKGKEEDFKSLFSIPQNIEAKCNTDGYVSYYSTTNSYENWAETWKYFMEYAYEFKSDALIQYAKNKDLLWSKFNYILDVIKIDYSGIDTPPFVVDMFYTDLPESDGIIASGETVEAFIQVRTLISLGKGYLLLVPYGNKSEVNKYINESTPIPIKSAPKGTYLTDMSGNGQFVISFPVKEGITPEKSIPLLCIYYTSNYGKVNALSTVTEIPVYNRINFCLGDEDYIWKFYGNYKLAGRGLWPKEISDFWPDCMKNDLSINSMGNVFTGKKYMDLAWDEKNRSIWWYTSYEEYFRKIELHKLHTYPKEFTSFDIKEKLPWPFYKDHISDSGISYVKNLEEVDMKINPLDGIVWIIFKIYFYPDKESSYRILAFDPETESIIKEITIPSDIISPDLKLESKHWLLDPTNNLIWISHPDTLNYHTNIFSFSMESGELENIVDTELSVIKEFHLDPGIQRIWVCGFENPNSTGFRIRAFSYQGNEELEVFPDKLLTKMACNPYDHSLWILFNYTGEIIKYDQDGNVLFKKQVFKGFKPDVGQKKYFYNIKPITENGSVMIVLKDKTPDHPEGDWLEVIYRYDLRRYSLNGKLEASSQNFMQTNIYTGYYLPSSDILGEMK